MQKKLNSNLLRGEKWGEKGFGRLARNKNNHCGIGKKIKLKNLITIVYLL